MSSSSVSCTTFRLRFFSLFFYLSPLCPGTCARSTDSFSPIISEISPTYSGVIICPFMTQQSSSILIFGTFIVTHSFAICSFRHWIGSDAAPCWHSLHTHTELPRLSSQQRFIIRTGGAPSLIVHPQQPQTLSFITDLRAPNCPLPPHSIKLASFIQQVHFSAKVSFINVLHTVFNGFFQYPHMAPYLFSMVHCRLLCCGRIPPSLIV